MESNESRLDLAHYLDVVRRRRVLLLLPPLLCMVGAYFLSASGANQYRSSVQIRVESEQIDTEVGLVTTASVRQRAEEILGDDAVAVDSVTSSRIDETQLMIISVTSGSPAVAADAANAWGSAFIETRNQAATGSIEDERDLLLQSAEELSADIVTLQARVVDLQRQLADAEQQDEPSVPEPQILAELTTAQTEVAQLEARQRELNDRATELDSQLFELGRTVVLVDPAQEPGAPFSPKPTRAAVTGLLAGALLGLLAAGIAEVVDDPVWDVADAERWVGGIPVIASIPPMPSGTPGVPVTLDKPGHPASEAYRVLRTALQFLALEDETASVMITSANLGDGKTTTAANLAVAMATGGARTVLVDYDLRRSSVHESFAISNVSGVTSALLGDRTIEQSLVRFDGLESGLLDIMPAGPPPPNPSELVSSAGSGDLIDSLASTYDVVLVDTPPILAVSDAMGVAQHVDGAVIVVRARRTRGRALANAIDRIERSGVELLGVVLNDDFDKLTDLEYTSISGGNRFSVRGRRRPAPVVKAEQPRSRRRFESAAQWVDERSESSASVRVHPGWVDPPRDASSPGDQPRSGSRPSDPPTHR